jgi:hypothetical protein
MRGNRRAASLATREGVRLLLAENLLQSPEGMGPPNQGHVHEGARLMGKVQQLESAIAQSTRPKSARHRFTDEQFADITRRVLAKVEFTKGLGPDADHVMPGNYECDGYGILKYQCACGVKHEIRIGRWLLGVERGYELEHDEMACHLNSCGSKACINTRHMYVGDAASNNADRIASGKRSFKTRGPAGDVYRELVASESKVKVARTLGVPYSSIQRATA